MPGEREIRQATTEDLDFLAPLFDAYRRFYRQPDEPERARRFLRERLEQRQSIVFLAFVNGAAIGFTQLYPSFSSGSLAPIFILNDLFVVPEARRSGTGTALLHTAATHGRRAGAPLLVLSTELTNTSAQALYEKSGWRRNTVSCVYQLLL